MNKQLLYVFGMVLVVANAAPVLAQAQNYNSGTKQELDDVDQLYPKRAKVVAQPEQTTTTRVDVTQVKTQPVQPAQPTVAAAPVAAPVAQQQPIYILQQPTTNVDATPVKESRAEQLRKQREEVEHQNENKLIERLEDERLNAEKDRVDKILNPQPAPAPAPAPAAAAPAPQQPQTVVVVPPPQKEIIETPEPVAAADATSRSSLKEDKDKEEKREDRGRLAIGGLVGVGSYPTVSNVNGAYALGGTIEYTMPNHIAVEGTVAYSSYDIQNAGFCLYCFSNTLVTTMNQWDITGGVKYKFFPGPFTPVAGGLLGYTRRDYKSRVSWGYGTDSGTGSNAFDGGLLIGAEVKCSDNITIGGDFRYMMNISYRTDNPLAYGFYGSSVYTGSPIESLNYYLLSINTKVTF